MKTYKYPSKNSWVEILRRPYFENTSLEKNVEVILKEVKERGDEAVRDFTERFDKVSINEFLVEAALINKAEKEIDQSLKEAIALAKKNIETFHKAQYIEVPKTTTSKGVSCWQKLVAIEKVGLYVPGGTAPLLSTVLMLAVPAIVAGCKEIILCSPPDKEGKIDPAILYTAKLCGIEKIYSIGGAQAIGAMAYGTASVPKVYKIFGPGNQYVTMAKQLVSKEGTAIDMPAGPSEVLAIADDTSDPVFVAADLLAQAEHGVDSQAVLVACTENILNQVMEELPRQLEKLPRKEIATEALKNSLAILVKDMEEAIAISNEYAPEHLIIGTDNAEQYLDQIINAGSVFVGHYATEPSGDYASGTNHTLPTNGFAKAFSGVSLDSFIKKITFQYISAEGIQNIGPAIEKMAAAEKLDAHKNAVTVRLRKLRVTGY